MPVSDQRINRARYQVIPRVLVFAFRQDAVLLMKLLPRNGKITKWTGRFNGVGGHVERGEDVSSAAQREFLEETGLTGELALCGTIIVDTEISVGLGLFVFRADNVSGELIGSTEGIPEWVPFEMIGEYPLVEDVSIILKQIEQMKHDAPPFAGHSHYDENGKLKITFGK